MTSQYSWPIIKLSIFAIICISLIFCLKFNPAPAQIPICKILPDKAVLRPEDNRDKVKTLVKVVLLKGTRVSTISSGNDKNTTGLTHAPFTGRQGKEWTMVKVQRVTAQIDGEGYVSTSDLYCP